MKQYLYVLITLPFLLASQDGNDDSNEGRHYHICGTPWNDIVIAAQPVKLRGDLANMHAFAVPIPGHPNDKDFKIQFVRTFIDYYNMYMVPHLNEEYGRLRQLRNVNGQRWSWEYTHNMLPGYSGHLVNYFFLEHENFIMSSPRVAGPQKISLLHIYPCGKSKVVDKIVCK